MSEFFQLVGTGVDVNPVLDELAARPDLWGVINYRATWEGSPHTEMTDIWVRYGADHSYHDPHIPVWYPAAALLPSLRPIIFGLMHAVQGEMLGMVLITKLPPGGRIAPHADRGWHAGYYDKFFVPLANEPGAVFCFPDGEIDAKPGEIWTFRNDVQHWVKNDSATDRIACIVCIRREHPYAA